MWIFWWSGNERDMDRQGNTMLTFQLDKDRKAILERKGSKSAGKKDDKKEGDVEMVE